MQYATIKKSSKCRTVKVTDTEPYYIRAVSATKAFIHSDKGTTVYIG